MVGNSFFKGIDEKIGRQKQEQIEEKETLGKVRISRSFLPKLTR